jgi:hypothetical protein
MPKEDAPEKMAARKLPDFKVTSEQVRQLKTMSAIMNMMADNKELMQKVAKLYVKAANSDPDERLNAAIDLKEKVTALVTESLKNIPAEDIDRYYPQWSSIVINPIIAPIRIKPWTTVIVDPAPCFRETNSEL